MRAKNAEEQAARWQCSSAAELAVISICWTPHERQGRHKNEKAAAYRRLIYIVRREWRIPDDMRVRTVQDTAQLVLS